MEKMLVAKIKNIFAILPSYIATVNGDNLFEIKDALGKLANGFVYYDYESIRNKLDEILHILADVKYGWGPLEDYEKSIAASVVSFKPLPNRLELIAEIDDVSWYDDSISTTGDSAIAALDAFEGPVIIIAGGYDKKLSLDEFAKHIAARAKVAVLIGQTAETIARTVRENRGKADTTVKIASSMAEAVDAAAALSEPGDVVLLSPACASYDMFDNYRHRSDVFTECVRQMKR